MQVSLVPCMVYKPDKFGIKPCTVFDVERKYLFNGFSYLGKEETTDSSAKVPINVMIKLMQSPFKRKYNLTCGNCFASLDVATNKNADYMRLFAKFFKISPCLPKQSKSCSKLCFSKPLPHRRHMTLACNHSEKAKPVIIRCTLHPDVTVSFKNNFKNKKAFCFGLQLNHGSGRCCSSDGKKILCSGSKSRVVLT